MAFLPCAQLGALGVGDVHRVARGQDIRVAGEFLAHAKVQDDQRHAAGVLPGDAHNLNLVEGLAQAKGLEDGAPAASDRPAHRRVLEGL
ncbi:hypothetical protein D9M73_103470 [compost metagenome]